jgi:CBS domain-containing protein
MRRDDHAFPVLESGRVVGIVTLDDVRAVNRDEWDRVAVQNIMTPIDELAVVETNSDAAEAMKMLSGRDVRQLPVLRDGQLAGVLRRRDIIQWLHLESEAM